MTPSTLSTQASVDYTALQLTGNPSVRDVLNQIRKQQGSTLVSDTNIRRIAVEVLSSGWQIDFSNPHFIDYLADQIQASEKFYRQIYQVIGFPSTSKVVDIGVSRLTPAPTKLLFPFI